MTASNQPPSGCIVCSQMKYCLPSAILPKKKEPLYRGSYVVHAYPQRFWILLPHISPIRLSVLFLRTSPGGIPSSFRMTEEKCACEEKPQEIAISCMGSVVL